MIDVDYPRAYDCVPSPPRIARRICLCVFAVQTRIYQPVKLWGIRADFDWAAETNSLFGISQTIRTNRLTHLQVVKHTQN